MGVVGLYGYFMRRSFPVITSLVETVSIVFTLKTQVTLENIYWFSELASRWYNFIIYLITLSERKPNSDLMKIFKWNVCFPCLYHIAIIMVYIKVKKSYCNNKLIKLKIYFQQIIYIKNAMLCNNVCFNTWYNAFINPYNLYWIWILINIILIQFVKYI